MTRPAAGGRTGAESTGSRTTGAMAGPLGGKTGTGGIVRIRDAWKMMQMMMVKSGWMKVTLRVEKMKAAGQREGKEKDKRMVRAEEEEGVASVGQEE